MKTSLSSVFLSTFLFTCIQANPLPRVVSRSAAVDPVVKGTPEVLGIVSDPTLNRDSCGSVKINNRLFWTCRDTQYNDENGHPYQIIFSTSTAAWSDLNLDGSPELEPISGSPTGQGNLMKGSGTTQPYFTYPTGECETSPAGSCDDGTRWVLWPDSPPMTTGNTNLDGSIPAYSWIRQSHIQGDLSEVNPDPPTALYRIDVYPSTTDDSLPPITRLNDNFWADGEISYGSYGNVVKDGIAYLFARPTSGQVAVAKVSVDSIEDSSQYQFWVNGGWSTTKPAVGDNNYDTVATAGGQGTFYFSDPWQSYVWIGQAAANVAADFYITTASEPQGPWSSPKLFYSGANGNYSLGSYSLQANPGMVPNGLNEIYLTYTKNDYVEDVSVYTTPLILVEWE